MLLLGAWTFVFPSLAAATSQYIRNTTVTYVEAGWAGEGMALHLATPAVSNGCPSGSNLTDFAIASSHPSYAEEVTLLYIAYVKKKTITVVIEDTACAFGNRSSVTSIQLSQ